MVNRKTAADGQYVLWVGTVLRDDENVVNSAASPAASRWQRELLLALSRRNCEVVLLSHVPQRIWPAGRIFPHHPTLATERIATTTWLRYLNVPWLKSDSIFAALKREFIALVERSGRPRAVVTYNPTAENVRFGLHCQESTGTPWIDLCADAAEPGPTWAGYPEEAHRAWGHVFLSHYAFKHAPFPRKLHLDGGITWVGGDEPCRPSALAFLYTGMMSKWGGVDALLRAFDRIRDSEIELWICGHGQNESLNGAVKRDSRVRALGLLPSANLDDVCRRASVFVNPRPANVEGNSMNFPSKLLHYLGYGKPVVSTLTPGVSDDYRSVVMEVPSENEVALARTMERAIALSGGEQADCWARARQFAGARSWDVQAERLLAFIRET